MSFEAVFCLLLSLTFAITGFHERVTFHKTSRPYISLSIICGLGVFLFSEVGGILLWIFCIPLIGIISGVVVDGPARSYHEWSKERNRQRRQQRFQEAQEQAKIDAMRIPKSQNRVVRPFHVPDREQQINDAEHIARRFRD